MFPDRVQYILLEIPATRKHFVAIPSSGAIVGKGQKMVIAEKGVHLAAEFAFLPFAEQGDSWLIIVSKTEHSLRNISGIRIPFFGQIVPIKKRITI